MHQTLSKSFINRFPFRLCTTSFIYNDSWVENVRLLAPFFDEVEILQFESTSRESYPSIPDIDRLLHIADRYQISYNIHLPIDIHPGDPNQNVRMKAAQTIAHSINHFSKLSPTTYTLHLPFDYKNNDIKTIRLWQKRIMMTLDELIQSGISCEQLSIETLDYPFEWVEPIMEEFCLSVCLDIGHLLRYHYHVVNTIKRYLNKTSIIHIHGVKSRQDHLALDHLNTKIFQNILMTLKGYTETLSIEVFNFRDLERSMAFLDQHWTTAVTG